MGGGHRRVIKATTDEDRWWSQPHGFLPLLLHLHPVVELAGSSVLTTPGESSPRTSSPTTPRSASSGCPTHVCDRVQGGLGVLDQFHYIGVSAGCLLFDSNLILFLIGQRCSRVAGFDTSTFQILATEVRRSVIPSRGREDLCTNCTKIP